MKNQLRDLFVNARRPVILAGWGVRAANAIPALRRFVERNNIPVLLTWKGCDILPDDHPCYVGRPGAIGQRAANIIQQKADLLICIGARLDFDQVAYRPDNFAPLAKKIIVDIAQPELDKHKFSNQCLYCHDALDFLTELLDFDLPPYTIEWLDWCKALNKRFPVVLPEYWQDTDYVNPYCLVDALSDACGKDDVLALGSSGPCANIVYQAFRVKEGQRVINCPVLGAMGTGIPGAIGACLASGRKRTISVIGDGGFNLNSHELEVVRRLQLPIVFFVLNNGGYGSIVNMQERNFGGHYVGSNQESGLTLPPVDRLAACYDIRYRAIKNNSELVMIKDFEIGEVKRADPWARKLPYIIDVRVKPGGTVQEPRTYVEMVNGIPQSRPMEDLYPFLARDILQELMEY